MITDNSFGDCIGTILKRFRNRDTMRALDMAHLAGPVAIDHIV
eukprot:SAG31_NODE_18_length_35375_cov_22.525315_7_plen_43_part_00